MVIVVLRINEGFQLADVAAECKEYFGTGNPAAGNIHEFLPEMNTGVDPWQEGGYVSCRMPEEYAQAFEEALQTTTPTTCALVRVEWPGQEYPPITFVNADGVEQEICRFA